MWCSRRFEDQPDTNKIKLEEGGGWMPETPMDIASRAGNQSAQNFSLITPIEIDEGCTNLPDENLTVCRATGHIELVGRDGRTAPGVAHQESRGPHGLAHLVGAWVHQLQHMILAAGQNQTCSNNQISMCQANLHKDTLKQDALPS